MTSRVKCIHINVGKSSHCAKLIFKAVFTFIIYSFYKLMVTRLFIFFHRYLVIVTNSVGTFKIDLQNITNIL